MHRPSSHEASSSAPSRPRPIDTTLSEVRGSAADESGSATRSHHTPTRLSASTSGSTLSPRVPFQRAGSYEPPYPQHQPPATPPSAGPPSAALSQPPSPRLRHIRGIGSTPTSSVTHHPAGATPNHSVDALPNTADASARTPTLAMQHLADSHHQLPLPRRLFDPVINSSRTSLGTPSPPPLQHTHKEKSSLEMEPDDVAGGIYSHHTPAGVPDRYNTQTPAFMSSDGDGSSHSGPSRTSTPFYGEWADGTDYESAYEGDAVIPMDSIREHPTSTVIPASAIPALKQPGITPNNKSGLYIHPTVRSDHAAPPSLAEPTQWSRSSRGRRGASGTRVGRRKGGKEGWSSWLRSLGPDSISSRLFGVPSADSYQRLTTTDSPKSPEFQQLHSYSRHYGSGYTSGPRYNPKFHPSMLSSPPQLMLWLLRSVQAYLARFHPFTLAAALLFVAGFVTSTTLLIIWILNPDKEPKPWRAFCAQSSPFPHDLADSLAPVDVFVGVMTMDSRAERRSVIRSTYGAHTRPVDPITGLETSNVQLKFVMGRPRKAFERSVALEMEMYNDIVVLDVQENMNKGKTHAFFRWAAENGTVPILIPRNEAIVADAHRAHSSNVGGTGADRVGGGLHLAHTSDAKQLAGNRVRGTVHGANGALHDVAWKKADYVVKADDDAFLRLDELERHLRVSPRKMTYWGYLIRNWFMGGESYAVSADLVEYFATSPRVAAHIKGKEDKVTAHWISTHPNASMVNYISEHCWIYDHPKSGTAYAHGFLFPDEVERIKMEAHRGLSDDETRRRGGAHAAQWYSTVSHWKHKYAAPVQGLSLEEEMEALVEGGGVFRSTGYRSGGDSTWAPWQDRVYEAEDARLKELAQGTHHGLKQLPARLRADWTLDEGSHLPVYTRATNATAATRLSVRDSSEETSGNEEHGEEEEEEDDDDHSAANKLLDSLPLVGAFKHFALAGNQEGPGAAGQYRNPTTTARSPSESDSARNATSPGQARSALEVAQRRQKQKVPVPQNAGYLSSSFGEISVDDLQASRFLVGERERSDTAGDGDAVAHSSNSSPSDGSATSSGEPEDSSSASSSTAAAKPPRLPSPQAHRSHRGGTVVVHFLKRNEWFYETALALIGRDRMRARVGRGSEWSMWGSPDAHAVHRGL